MPLTESHLAKLEMLLGSTEPTGNPLAGFRQQFPGLSLTRCDPLDMSGEEPFRAFPKFDLYLVDGSDHCWRLTDDPVEATGIVVAERR